MGNKTLTMSKILATVICLAMVLSTTVIISDKASAEIVTGNELSMPEMPPYPPFTIYGIIHDESGMPVSDASVTITNLRTGESLDAEFYENGAYEGILEDLPSGYAVNDNIEIIVTTNLKTMSKVIVVENMGFGERVDIHFNDGKNSAGSENILATNSKIQNNALGIDISNYDTPPPIPAFEPEITPDASDPIIIDPLITNPLIAEQDPDIILVDIRCPPGYRYALDGQRTMVNLTLGNIGDVRYIVIAELANIKPSGQVEFIDTLTFGAIMPGHEKTKRTFWTPDTIGENYIRIDISIREKREIIPLTSYDASFYVVPSENVIYWHDKVIDEPQEFYDVTIISFGDLVINADTLFDNCTVVIDPLITTDVEVNATTNWKGSLGTYLMDVQTDGGLRIDVTSNGTFNIFEGAHVTSTDTTTPKRYQFTVNGALNIDSSTIEYVWGNTTDLSLPGGIQCYNTNNVNITGNSVIRNGATHGIWLQNSDAVITGSYIHDNGGDGIVSIDGSAPSIEGNTVEWNGRYGINANGSFPAIKNANTIQYNRLDGIFIENVISAEGKPDYIPGTNLGYFIWYDETGWYIRWSGDGSLNYFNGSITFNDLTATIDAIPVDLNLADEFSITGTSISFNATEDFGEEGFDFTFSGASVNFDLWLNGVYVTSKIFIGSGGMKPVSIPFVLAEGVTITDNTITLNMASGLHLVDTNIPITDNTISSNGLDPVFEDDFEIDLGWTNESLWHRISNEGGAGRAWNVSHSGDWSWRYGLYDDPTYDNGTRNWGNLTSTTIDIRNATSTALTFWNWYETDTTTDQRWVIIRNDTMPDTNVQLVGGDMNTWTRYIVNISDFAGMNITVSFYFDTVDDLDNANQGWYIDDVEVITAYPVLEGHGIHLEGVTPSLLYNNTIEMNNWHGIYGYSNTLSEINNNNVSGNRKNGIIMEHSNSIIITNNTASSNNNYGIYLFFSNSNTIANNNASSNNYGIYLDSSSGNTIANNNVLNKHFGIYLDFSSSNTITNNNASNNYFGIFAHSSSSNTITNNIASSNNNVGISLYFSSSNILVNNTASNNNFGIYIYFCSNSNTIANNISSNNYGISLSSSDNNTFDNNTASNNNNYGIYLGESSGNTIADNTVLNNGYGVFFYSATGNQIINSTIIDSSSFDLYLESDSHATALNTAFNKTKVYFADTLSTLTVQWFMDVCVVNENFDPVPDASVWVNDTFGNPVISSITPDGWIRWIHATEYVQDQAGTTNYTQNITASNATLTGWAMPEPFIDQNRVVYVLLGAGNGYNVFLQKGWNLVSIPYEPYNMSSTNILEVLKSIEGKWEVVKWYNVNDPADPWKTHKVGWTNNDLHHLNHTMGFWLRATEPCTLFAMGIPQAATNITLYTGWNMVGYPTDNNAVNISTALSGISAYRDMPVEGYFADFQMLIGPYEEDYIMLPGQGYWIHVNATCTWTVDW